MNALAAFLAMIGCTVGFLRSAFPSRAQLFGRAASIAVAIDGSATTGDDSGPSVRLARTHRGGLRRAATTLGAGLPDDEASREAAANRRAARPDRDVLVPRSFVPPPPFHPPREA